MLGRQALSDAAEPASVTEAAGRDLTNEEFPKQLGADLHVAEDAELRNIQQPGGCDQLPLALDLETAAIPTDDRALFRDVDRPGAGSRGISRRSGSSCRPAKALVSSGRQMPTSEQRGHLGLSSNGAGGSSRPAM